MKAMPECISIIYQRVATPWEVGSIHNAKDIEKANLLKRDKDFLKNSLDGCGMHGKTAGQGVEECLRAPVPTSNPSSPAQGRAFFGLRPSVMKPAIVMSKASTERHQRHLSGQTSCSPDTLLPVFVHSGPVNGLSRVVTLDTSSQSSCLPYPCLIRQYKYPLPLHFS